MARLVMVVEGHAEEAFVNQLLQPHLAERGVYCFASRVEFSRHKGQIHRGGLLDWGKADRDIRRWLRTHQGGNVHFTTMFDLDALPENTPGRGLSTNPQNPEARVTAIEGEIGKSIGDRRFFPYIQLHEFEALVLVDAAKLGEFYPNRKREAVQLAEMVTIEGPPERINDGNETAPSKRIIKLIPEYHGGKRAVSPFVLERIGLDNLRSACPHFGAWLTCLESLGTPTPRESPPSTPIHVE